MSSSEWEPEEKPPMPFSLAMFDKLRISPADTISVASAPADDVFEEYVDQFGEDEFVPFNPYNRRLPDDAENKPDGTRVYFENKLLTTFLLGLQRLAPHVDPEMFTQMLCQVKIPHLHREYDQHLEEERLLQEEYQRMNDEELRRQDEYYSGEQSSQDDERSLDAFDYAPDEGDYEVYDSGDDY